MSLFIFLVLKFLFFLNSKFQISNSTRSNIKSMTSKQNTEPLTNKEQKCEEGSQNIKNLSGLSEQVICLKSIQIVKSEIDTSCYQKLNISIVLNQLSDDSRKMIRYISSKYAMNLYDDWDKFWNKQKQVTKSVNQKGKSLSLGSDQLMIINEDCLVKILRQMKLNPSLRVILLVKNMQSFKLKQEYSFMLVTDCCKQIEEFLVKIKKRLIVTSRT